MVAASGLLPGWWAEKVGGVLRLVGVNQETGFNASPGADLTARLVEMVTRFGTSYVLLGLGLFAGLAAAFSAVAVRRVVGLVATTSGALGLYCVVGGAAEEQFGYYVIVTSVLALGAVWADLRERRPVWRRPAAVLVLAFTLVTVGLGVSARATTDDSFRQARGYGYAAPALLDWLSQHATPVFTASGPSNGDTVVWRLDPAALDAAVAAGVTLPPVDGGYS